ncbi:MAG: hypothetical protein N2606_04340 [Candidatus Omnitrophica bacterium]|nr:hypothetical protein [Candidatus Omnitrophota bacterium]
MQFLNRKNISFVIFIFLFFIMGCASVKEASRGLAGISTQALEERFPGGRTIKVKMDYDNCVNQTRILLKQAGAYIYKDSPQRKLIAVYVSETDTTPVGLFFESIDEKNTYITFTSQSDYARDYIAEKVEAAFNKR